MCETNLAMGSIIQSFERITKYTCLKSRRYQLDYERASMVDFDDNLDQQYVSQPGERSFHAGTKSVYEMASMWAKQESPLCYFLDGSRRTYKIEDFPINSQCLPMIAGQVGVGVCERVNRQLRPWGNFKLKNVLAVTVKLHRDGSSAESHNAYFANLRDQINADAAAHSLHFLALDELLYYQGQIGDNFEDKAIARIQDYMIEQEKRKVAELVQAKCLSDDAWLLKDGSLEYAKINRKDDEFVFNNIRSNYQHVIGVSKSFNPELARMKNNQSASLIIAKLKQFERTPAFKYRTDRVDGEFAIWYLRIRDSHNYNQSPFDGVVKVEKVLVSPDERENGLATEEVDNISSWIVNERNPVCYGKDSRWQNHLYPVYLTEQFVKSRYMSTEHFTNLF